MGHPEGEAAEAQVVARLLAGKSRRFSAAQRASGHWRRLRRARARTSLTAGVRTPAHVVPITGPFLSPLERPATTVAHTRRESVLRASHARHEPDNACK
jgi:hypothetical protein